jgi:signal transduction histidine kinase
MGLLFAALTLVVQRADHIITARAEELQAAYTSLRQAESIRDDLTNMIVHDLRTPLSVMTASLDLITRGEAEAQSEPRSRFVRTARSAGRRMTGLIDDLLSVAKMEAGELQPGFELTSIPALFADQLSDFSVQAAAEGRELCIDCPPGLTAQVDPAQIGRVLANLVGNAFKYTRRGGAIHIAACEDVALNRVYVAVRDDGEGIPDDYKARIFDKFVQVPQANGYPTRKGTGLGLTFCRLVIEAHAGHIWVEDASGGGSVFKFWVPEVREA